jgi:hypothetical protein
MAAFAKSWRKEISGNKAEYERDGGGQSGHGYSPLVQQQQQIQPKADQ